MKSAYNFYLIFLVLLTPLNTSTASGIAVIKNTEGTLSVEVESNDDVDSANPIYSDIQVTGNISETDVDYFTFSLTEPSLMTLSSTSMEALIQVFNPDGSELYYKDYESRGFTTSLSGVSSGNYLIKISAHTKSYDSKDKNYDFTLSFPQNISPDAVRITNLEGNVSILSAKLLETNGSLQSSLASNISLSSQKVSLETNLTNANTELSYISSQLSETNDSLQKTLLSNTSLTSIKSGLDAQLTTANSNISLLTSQLSETNSSLQTALTSNVILSSQKASIETQLNIANIEVSSLNTQLASSQDSLQAALASNTILTSQKASLDAQLATANSNISSLTSQLSTSTSRVSALESEINNLKSQTSNSSISSNQTTNQNTSSTVEEVKKVASIKAYGLHAFLDVGSSTLGGKLYFTSYDGKSSWPLNDSNRVSGELKPLYSGSSSFVTDYLVANSYGIYEHGTVSLSISSTDSDKNGVPDWLQKNMSVNEYISGNSQVHYLSPTAYGGDSSISGTFTRSAGLSSGNYNLNYTITGVGSAKATGVWYIGFYEGTVKYDNSIYEIDAQTLNSSGNKVTATGSSEYSISSSDNLNIGVLNLSYGSSTVQLQAGSLSRDGNTYSGFAKAVDGNTDTSWADYVDWYIEITDPNDGDKDGVPDFTDPIQQAITPSSVDISGWNWHSWPWVYNHSIQNWLYYHKGASGYAVWNNSDRSWYGWNAGTESWNKLSQ